MTEFVPRVTKKYLAQNVYDAARERIKWTFDEFDRICVSYSGGKDSSAMLHMVMEEAIRRGRKVHVLFIDWEAQYKLLIDHVQHCFDIYSDHIIPFWVCLPLTTTNATSVIEPEWVCWEPEKRDLWVRDFPVGDGVITDSDFFPFYESKMTFEDFIQAFGEWFGKDELSACMIGIRANESLNRFRTLFNTRKGVWKGKQFTTLVGNQCYNVYPIYDWRTEDVWTYFGKFNKAYTAVYDRMHQAGLTISQMRICEPYGDEQRKGLWLYHVIEPQTWNKVVCRVAGANNGALYAHESGNVLGNLSIKLPEGYTWKSFSEFLLNTLPPKTSLHYSNKIAVYLKWCLDHGVAVPDEAPNDTSNKDVPSWRRVCKMLLKNDYWCRTLSFSPTKNAAYSKYLELMKRRREEWGNLLEKVSEVDEHD